MVKQKAKKRTKQYKVSPALSHWCKIEEDLGAALAEQYWRMSIGLRFSKTKIAELEKKGAKHAHTFLKKLKTPREVRLGAIGTIAGYKTYRFQLKMHELHEKAIVSHKYTHRGRKVNWNTWRAWATQARDNERKEVFDLFIKKSPVMDHVTRQFHERSAAIFEQHDENPLDVYLEEHKISKRDLVKFIQRIERRVRKPFRKAFRETTQRFLGREPRYYDDMYFMRNAAFTGFSPKQIPDPLVLSRRVFKRLGFSLNHITIDEADRPGKAASAFCLAVRIPQDVRISYRHESAMQTSAHVMHELGHAVHESHIHEKLPYWVRAGFSMGLAETFSTFFEGFFLDEPFLKKEVGLTKDETKDFLTRTRFTDLYTLAFYCANSLFKIAFWSKPLKWNQCNKYYAQQIKRCLGIPIPGAYWKLHHILPERLMYVPSYLMAMSRSAALRKTFRNKYGNLWWQKPQVGRTLHGYMHPGDDSELADFSKISPAAMLEELKC